jgi:hypothetical protein
MKYIITEEQLNNATKSIIELIDKEGIITASKFVSGYYNLKELLGDYEIPKQLKIDTIKNYIDTKTDGGIHLGELDEEPIPYYEDSDGYHHIEYLSYSYVIVNVWGGYENQIDKGEYQVYYDKLTSKTLDDIIEMLISHS